MNADVCIRLLI